MSPLPFPSLPDGDWATLRFILERMSLLLPAVQGTGRLEVGIGSIDLLEASAAFADVTHHLGVPPIVVFTPRHPALSSTGLWLTAVTSDDFSVEAGPTGDPGLVGTYYFNWYAYGHDAS